MKHAREAPDALRFYAELQQRTSVAACSALFKKAIAGFGFVAFACGEIDLADRSRNVMFIAEWPEAWLHFYVRSGFINRDPIVNALAFYREPFEFADIVREPRFSNGDREALRAAAEYGWGRGLAVPVARGGTRFGLVTMIGRGEKLDEFQRTYLCLISECLINRIHSLPPGVEYAAAGGHEQARGRGGAACRRRLRGPQDRRQTRNFQSTAHKHVESGRKRLRARNRAHMAALSLSLGIARLA